MPFGLNLGPYIFTKITRPILQYLRGQNIVCSANFRWFLVITKNQEDSKDVKVICDLLSSLLGFWLNLNKSELIPKQEITYLGFNINSNDMTVGLPQCRKDKILGKISMFLNRKSCKIRDFAGLIWTLIAVKPAVKYWWLHIKMERQKCTQVFLITIIMQNDITGIF